MDDIALTKRYPAARSIPRVELGEFPTPVEPAERLAQNIGLPRLYIKRDDQTGTLYGGNKVRKLEFLLGQAVAEGFEAVWTVGAIGSHHCLATAIYARELGLEPHILHFPQPVTDHVLKNLRALSTTRPKLTLTSKVALPFEVGKEKVKQWVSSQPDVFYIPGGGSSPVGVLGYVNAGLELADQIAAGELDEPDYIFVAAGTCGTLAGLVLGCKMAGLATRVVGVRVVDKIMANKPITSRLANRAGQILADHGVEAVPQVTGADFEMADAYFGRDYGVPTEAGMAAIHKVRELAGVDLEPTYTGKAFAGLLGERERLELSEKTVLYWHTLSGADLGERIARADVDQDLPDEYRDFFEQSA